MSFLIGISLVLMQHSTHTHGGFVNLSFVNSLVVLYLMEKYVFNSNVHETLATTCENYLLYSMLLPCGQIP